MDFGFKIKQDGDVHSLELSDDGKYVVTLDTAGRLWCFETATTRMLWEYQLKDEQSEYQLSEEDKPVLGIFKNGQMLLYSDQVTSYFFSISTGELLHQILFAEEGRKYDENTMKI